MPAPRAKPKVPVGQEDFYAPVGLVAGSFRLLPYVELMPGYDVNPPASATPVPASFTGIAVVGSAFKSLWARHELQGEVSSGYTKFFSYKGIDMPKTKADVSGRFDMTSETALEGRLTQLVSVIEPGTPGIGQSDFVNRPDISTFSAMTGIRHTAGLWELSFQGTAVRTDNADGFLKNGERVRLSEQNNTTFGIRAQQTYRWTPVISPFLMTQANTVVMNMEKGVMGSMQDTSSLGAEVGAKLAFSQWLNGTIGAGYMYYKYADTCLHPAPGALVDASLEWMVSPLTKISLVTSFTQIQTGVEANGTFARKVDIGISHALRRNLTIDASVSYSQSIYVGARAGDQMIIEKIGVSYALSRHVVLKAIGTWEHFSTTTEGSHNYDNPYVSAGVRFQY
jgi:hypothetical protein